MDEENQKLPPHKESSLPRIRTYETDIEIRKKSGISPSDMVAKAGILREENLNKMVEKKIILIAILILSVLGTTLGLYFSQKEQDEKEVAQPIQIQIGKPYIKTSLEKIINFSSSDPGSLISAIKKEIETAGKSDSLLFLMLPQTLEEFSQFIGIKMPKSLLQNSYPSFNIFVAYHNGSSSMVFLIKTENFEKTYSSMLSWEKDIWQSFNQFLAAEDIKNINGFSFFDEIIKNHDSRVLSNRDRPTSNNKSQEEKVILAYTIFNKQFVVIATSRKALSIILERLIASPPK